MKSGPFWGYINKAGIRTIPPQFDQAFQFIDGLALIERNRTWSYVDTAGKIVRLGVWVSD